MAGAVLVYAFCAWGFVRPGAYVPFVIPVESATLHHDQVYSARVAYFSQVSGQESDVFLLQMLDPAYIGAKPYHYFELWLTNIVSTIFRERQIGTLYLVVYPFFFWLALIGILALWEAAGRRINGWAFLASLALMFVGGFTFGFYQLIPFLSWLETFKFSLLSWLPKLGQVYAFLLAFALLVQQRKGMLALLTLLMVGANYIVIFPAIGLAAGLGAGWALVFGVGSRAMAGRAVGYVLAMGLGMAGFYHYFDISTVGREGASTKDVAGLLDTLFAPEALRTKASTFVGTLLRIPALYGPYLLAVALFGRVVWREIAGRLAEAAFWVVLIGGSIVAWTIFYKHLNSVQLFTNLGIPVANVLLFKFAVWLAGQHSSWRRWAVVVLMATSAVWFFEENLRSYPLKNLPPVFADNYLQKVDGYLKTQPGPWLAGASLRHLGAFKGRYEKYVTIYTNGTYLPYLGNGGAVAISLNDVDIVLDPDPAVREQESQAVGMGLFYRWVAREKAAGTFRDVPTSQLAFVRHYGLKFLIISKGVEVPATLKLLVVEEFADELSGERFLVLDPKK
jgi:hypothetical protein